MEFPLTTRYPVLFYTEQTEGSGLWSDVTSLEVKIPSSWDLDGRMLGYKSYLINTDSEQVGTIIIKHSTDLHYCADFSALAKEPYCIVAPQAPVKDYKYIFFKQYTEDEELLLDIVGFNNNESNLDALINFVLQKLVYESRYSQMGIQKQVEDAVETIIYQSLKKLIRFLGKILNVEYTTMHELTSKVVQSTVQIKQRDIYSIVYKTFLSVGLFPMHTEINTMNDSYFKLKLLSLFTNSEILPWSPKFHASLALANFHYSFTPNDLFNLRTLDSRKFHKGFQYIRVRILDFFPLDGWVEMVAQFFCCHFSEILQYIGDHINMPESKRLELVRASKKQSSGEESSRSSLLDLKEPLMRDEHRETELMYDSRNNPSNTPMKLSFLDEGNTDQIKRLFKHSLSRLTIKSEAYGFTFETPLIVNIKSQIAKEFYSNYQHELEDTGILQQFCQIITETELRRYSTCANNCQTPVAAFIYLLSDIFRPFSEVLYSKLNFLEKCSQLGLQFKHASKTQSVLNMQSEICLKQSSLKNNKLRIEHSQLSKQPIANTVARNQFENTLTEYCKYSSTINVVMMALSFVQPATLEQCLDYFGFFSDSLSSQFLQKIQEIDGNPQDFTARRQSRFRQTTTSIRAVQEEEYFNSSFEQAEREIMGCYTRLTDAPNQSIIDQVHTILLELEKPQLGFPQQSIHKELPPLSLHFLMQHYQNQVMKLKQEGEKNAQIRHHVQDLFDEASYYYYNSIRIQLSLKTRRNTLSYVGFVIGKDLNIVNNSRPANITLQTIK